MPVQMRNDITETGKIDLVRCIALTHGCLNGKNNRHQYATRCRIEITHFPDMGIPDNPAKPGLRRVVDPHNTAMHRLPKNISPWPGA